MPVNNLYYNKYIKYKNKYLNLQSQMGGVNPPLIKQNSTFISCQGNEETCWAHGSTILIMKLITNFFPTYFLPLQINDCNHYYDTLKCNIYTIFNCFLQIKKGNINCKSLSGDNIEKEVWPEENFYALLFHFIFSTLVEQYKIANRVFSVEAICLYILDYLKYIDITKDAFEEKTFYNNETGYNSDEQLYFNELITKSVELFKAVKESLNNKNFIPIIYRCSSVAHEIYSISEYQYYTQEFKCMFNDYERMPKIKISFKDKRANKTGFSSKLENLDPVYTNEHNLRNITGKTDLPTNIKYVLDQHYYALFYTDTHVITITDCSGSVDNLFLHIKDSSIIGTCSKEEQKTWCNLIEYNTISMNKLLVWDKFWVIVFFYPYEFFDKQINQFNQNTTVKFIKQIISDDKGKQIANALMKNKTVTELSFYQCTISDNTIKEIAEALKKNTTLKKISLWYNKIGDDGAKAIAEALEKNTTLTEIFLNDNKISDDGAKAIAEALEKNTTLTEIFLDNNMIGNDGAKAIAEALGKNTTLETINLSLNKMMGYNGTKAIAEALKINKKLKTIHLTYNQIGDDGTKEIAEALKINTNTKLETILLNYNNIGDDGAKAIAEALKINTKLETILLNSNNIGNDGAKAIAEALEINTILTSFNISDNKITEETKQHIKKSDVALRIIF